MPQASRLPSGQRFEAIVSQVHRNVAGLDVCHQVTGMCSEATHSDGYRAVRFGAVTKLTIAVCTPAHNLAAAQRHTGVGLTGGNSDGVSNPQDGDGRRAMSLGAIAELTTPALNRSAI